MEGGGEGGRWREEEGWKMDGCLVCVRSPCHGKMYWSAGNTNVVPSNDI